MIFSFHPEAKQELNQSIDFYEDREKGLGQDFTLEVYSTVERILAYPTAWPSIENDIRQSLVRRFPYGLLYSQFEKEIVIIAVMHLNREPNYWKSRI